MNPAHVNYGFHNGEHPPPPLPAYSPEAPPYYPNVVIYSNHHPAPVNTYHTVTPGVATHVQPAQPVRKGGGACRCVCILLVIIGILILLAIAAFLIAYFLMKDCGSGQKCGSSSSCVQTSQWCDGKKDCPGGEDEAVCFRNYGSNFLLQSFSNKDQEWKTVCSDKWDNNAGRRACEQMGYPSSTYVSSGVTSPSFATSYMTLTSPYTSSSSSYLHTLLSTSATCPTGLAVSLKCIDCGTQAPSTSRIVGGQIVTTYGRWPWQVSLQAGGGHRCGGSIITPSWIVTAAHCIQTYSSPIQWKVYAGYLTLTDMKYVSGNTLTKIIQHPNYDTDNNNNDVALMKLSTPLQMSSTIRPVCLPNAGLSFTAPRDCYISGWGTTSSGGTASLDLREAKISLIDRGVCNAQAVYSGQITNTMICAGSLAGGVDSCQGDSGGPLVTLENTLWWLVGDTSWGIGCAARNKPGVYGNMTVFVDWIQEQLQKQ